MDILKFIKEIVEIIYYLSGVGLLIGVIIGLKQFKLMKDDYKIRHKRSAIEKSIEYLNLFATDIIPRASEMLEKLQSRKVQFYKGNINKDFVFDNNCNLSSEYIKKNLMTSIECGGMEVLNRFEFFSAALNSGLAEEELAFNPLARFYCDGVEKLYIVICYSRREDNSTAFSNTIKLYNVWKARIDKQNLEIKRSKLDEEISKLKIERIQSILESQKGS